MTGESLLIVEFVDEVEFEGEVDPGLWCVRETASNDVVLWGFARRRDAEIAMEFLSEFSGIDYTLKTNEFWIQFGVKSSKELMSLACKRLQW